MKFVVRLKAIHDASGKTKYRVWKDTGISPTSIAKYVDEDEVEFGQLPLSVVQLCQYYGVNWKSPGIIEIVEDKSEGQIKTPLAEMPTTLAS